MVLLEIKVENSDVQQPKIKIKAVLSINVN